MSGRKVELDEVIVSSLELDSSSQKTVSVMPTPISEEANDDDHETSLSSYYRTSLVNQSMFHS